MKKIAALMSVVVLLLFPSGCDKSDDATGPGSASGTGGFTLNGAGFSNQSFTLRTMIGIYETSQNLSEIVGMDVSGADTTELIIGFAGKTTGTFQFGTDAGVIIMRMGATSSRFFMSTTGNGQIAVTAYGAVGGTITGTFSGRLYESTLSGLDSVTVSNGSFNAVRMADQ